MYLSDFFQRYGYKKSIPGKLAEDTSPAWVFSPQPRHRLVPTTFLAGKLARNLQIHVWAVGEMNGVGGIGADSAALRWYVCCKHGNSLLFYPT